MAVAATGSSDAPTIEVDVTGHEGRRGREASVSSRNSASPCVRDGASIKVRPLETEKTSEIAVNRGPRAETLALFS